MNLKKVLLSACLLPFVVACNSNSNRSTNTSVPKESLPPDAIAFNSTDAASGESTFKLQEFNSTFAIEAVAGGKTELIIKGNNETEKVIEEKLFEFVKECE